MKICILTHNINPDNGWGRYAKNLIEGLKKEGYEVLVLQETHGKSGEHSILQRRFGIIKSAFLTAHLAKDFDIIHALDIYPYGIIAWLASFFVRARFILSIQGSYSIAPLYSFMTRWFATQTIMAAKMIVAISKYTKLELQKVVPDAMVMIIHHGVDLEHFNQEHKPSVQNYILSVGAVKHRKGYHISIPAFAIARKNFPDLRYIIVGSLGDREYFKNIQTLAEKEGVSQAIEFRLEASDDELLRLYRGARLFILTSVNEGNHFEGFGLVFLEAAAAGLPVIGTTGNGIADAVWEGKNGLLIPQENIQAAADALLQILQHEDVWQRMSQVSKEWALQHSEKNVISQYLEVYTRVVAS